MNERLQPEIASRKSPEGEWYFDLTGLDPADAEALARRVETATSMRTEFDATTRSPDAARLVAEDEAQFTTGLRMLIEADPDTAMNVVQAMGRSEMPEVRELALSGLVHVLAGLETTESARIPEALDLLVDLFQDPTFIVRELAPILFDGAGEMLTAPTLAALLSIYIDREEDKWYQYRGDPA